MMAASSVKVLVEIEQGSSFRRWQSKAVISVSAHSSKLEVSGEAVIAEYKRGTTRSKVSFSTNSTSVEGKICIYESAGKHSSSQAVQFAMEAGARALLVAHEPEVLMWTMPVIVGEKELFKHITNSRASKISVAEISQSYKAIDVALKAQSMSTKSPPFQWRSKMFVPTSMIEKTINNLDFGIMHQVTPYRDTRNNIDSIETQDIQDITRNICLFDTEYPKDAKGAVEISTGYGASVLFIRCKKQPDWTSLNLTLPVVAIGNHQLEGLKRAGSLRTGDLGLTISYNANDASNVGEKKTSLLSDPHMPPQMSKLHQGTDQRMSSTDERDTTPISYAEAARGTTGMKNKPDPPQSNGILGGLGNLLDKARKVAFGYTPKSKDEFKAIIRRGTSWSDDRLSSTLFDGALDILDRIRTVESPKEREDEVESLMTAIREMAQKPDFKGDVLVILFTALLFSLKDELNIDAMTSELADAMVTMVKTVRIDPKGSKALRSREDKKILDACIVRLTRHVSNRASNRASLVGYALNALWIRHYHCDALGDGAWGELAQVTSAKHMEARRKIIGSFMDPAQVNSLIISMSHSLKDICKIFHRGEVPINSEALKKLRNIYRCNEDTSHSWLQVFDDSRELTVLNFVERITVGSAGECESLKKSIIRLVVERASFESVRSFQDLEDIFFSLAVDEKSYDTITPMINGSICRSLERRGEPRPTPSDVSYVMKSEVGLLLTNMIGWKAVMTFIQYASRSHREMDIFEMLGHIYDRFVREQDWAGDQSTLIDGLFDSISHRISSSSRCEAIAVAAFKVASSWHEIFFSPADAASICSRLSRLIISQTGLASSIRCDPSKLQAIPCLQLESCPGKNLIQCLSRELILELMNQCSKIEDAVTFCIKVNSVASTHSGPVAHDSIVPRILLDSFSKWGPSTMNDLLQVDGSTLMHIYKLLAFISQGDAAEYEGHRKKGEENSSLFKSIILGWMSKYNGDGFDAQQLREASSFLTAEKRESFIEISGDAFPTNEELGDKISAISEMLGTIRSILTIKHEKNGTSISHPIAELASAYRVDVMDGSLFSVLIGKYFSDDTEPALSLAKLHRDMDSARSFITENGRELQAASHFLTSKSILFQHSLGTWVKIRIEEFLTKVSTTLCNLANLLSSDAAFSDILAAAEVLGEDAVCAESELKAISSFPAIGIDDSCAIPRLLDIMTFAMLSEPLRGFIDCCMTLKFMFVQSDENFTLLNDECKRIFVQEGRGLVADECLEISVKVADVMLPQSSGVDLRHRLKMCLPILEFFDALRYCSNVFLLAKERMWFGEEGLQVFYKEWTNVSNVFKSNQSFENEVLDRLEPTIRAVSVVGGSLGCDSVASLFGILKENPDVVKIAEMRLVQANIYKVQDWFSEGMDDMAAILSKFASIQLSGTFKIESEASGSPVPRRILALQYSRSQTGDNELVTMAEDGIRELVQYLGFVNHDTKDSINSNYVTKFTDTYEELSQIRECQQAMLDVGFEDDFSTSTLEYALHESDVTPTAVQLLDESQQKLKECSTWLREIRSKNRYSMLFWMEELRTAYDCMSQLREWQTHEAANANIEELEPFQLILEAVSRFGLSVSQSPQCLRVLLDCMNDPPSLDISWLEEVSRLVNICGMHSETLQLTQLRANGQGHHKKKIVIHKINCSDEMTFSAPLHVWQNIYKSRRPASFEVFDGACTKSPQHLKLFLDRVLAFPHQTFTIACVDELPTNEQEIIANFLSKHSRSSENMELHCIQSRDTILHAPPGVEIRLYDNSSFNEEQRISWLRDHLHNATVVCGSPGSGKTRYIKGEMEKLATGGAEVASMYIHEDFSLSNAVSSLKSKFNRRTGPSNKRAIHFGFAINVGDETLSKDLALSINNFFNSFFVLQLVHDPSSGGCFYSGVHAYTIFIEVNCMDEDECRVWLERYVPILACCENIIQPPLEYIVDDETRRVCTYLRAYDNGSINRKFNPTPCNKRIMFVLDKSGSMEYDFGLGGPSALEVAADCMLRIFDSHLQLMDHIGLIRFNQYFEEMIPLQRVEDDAQRCRLRATMNAARNNPCGNTCMYTALSHAVTSLNRSRTSGDAYGDAWIICLTDGESWDSNVYLEQQLRSSSNNLHIILIGVNLAGDLNNKMNDLCNKYHQSGRTVANKGFFLPTSANMTAIEDAFSQVASRIPVSQTFELEEFGGIMSEAECRAKLEEHLPEFIDPRNKLQFSFWVNFLFRRVSVFDQNDDFNYNEEHDSLGSTLMDVMLAESRQMLRRDQNRSWASANHTQLIYDFSQQGSPESRLICTSPDDLDREQRDRLNQLNLPGFSIPTTSQISKRETLDLYLSQALSIPLNEGRLKCIDDNKFVLTLDFTLKLLNVHERVSCGVPCIMEGETGVSKTTLTKIYSILVNSQQHSAASESTLATLESISDELAARFPAVRLNDDNDVAMDRIQSYLEPSTQHSAEEASELVRDLINEACSKRSAVFASVPPDLVHETEGECVSKILAWFSESNLEPLFFDINIHASLTADDLKRKFDDAKSVAQKISSLPNAKVVVFLDEINTSSVLGLLKEAIIDRSLNGEPLEPNIVCIAACNPARKSRLLKAAQSREIDLGRDWTSGHYQVKKLHISLEMMLWDYGALNSGQEKEFIRQRINMMDEPMSDVVARGMTEVISCSHELMRTLAEGSYIEKGETECEAKLRARSAVSLRDIQRVFHFFTFFLRDISLGPHLLGESSDKLRRAMLLSVACVYYLRLDAMGRNQFLEELNLLPSEQCQDVHAEQVLESAINALIKHTELPVGIALTSGLKENVFMTLICALSRTPLMIIGPPGCSKTLSVSIVTDNANGEESPGLFFRSLARIQPFHYQCSKSSNSAEVAGVFDRAISRQSKVNRLKQQCLVFMDEAGLPEEEKESLKVLHYLLEGHMSASPEVSFVCITNHALDAAKSNRCVCLLRPEPSRDELMCIALGVLCQKHQGDESNIDLICFENQMVLPEEFCAFICCCYLSLIQNKEEFAWFVQFFGLRDLLHMIMFMRRNASLKDHTLYISAEVMVHSLERNFNGVSNEKFSNVCGLFLESFLRDRNQTEECLSSFRRHPVDVLQNALTERIDESSRYNLPRYKMIIDSSNDDSVMRLLRASGILNSSHSFYKLSGMKEGSEIEQLNLVSRIKFAAQQGDKTIVMSQVEEISECFYDLFNQHFKEFKKDGETSYFANIAIKGKSRPCIVHPSFQCIVHVQSNQLDEIPSPFLNRFEKYTLNVEDILSWQLARLPLGTNRILSSALSTCEELLSQMGADSFWSTSNVETLKSIFISMIPPVDVGQFNFSQIQSNGPVSSKRLICFSVLEFLKSSLVIHDITIEDVDQSVATALSELRGKDGIELRKLIRMERRLDESKLEKSLCGMADGALLDSPLSRSLELIVRATIVRHATFRLMQVAMPEYVFLQRDRLPEEALRVYFGCQEHFHLKSLISKLGRVPNGRQLYMLHIHSDLCAHSLPKWCSRENRARNSDGVSFEAKVKNLVHEDPSRVEIHHLDLLKSESSVRISMDSWASDKGVDFFILVVDMQLQSSSNLVNFIRAHVEQMSLAPMKKFLLLLHYPLSCDAPTYPALFLGNWQCIYLDGIGHHGVSNCHLSVNSVFETACFNDSVLSMDMLDALLPKAIQYTASQVPFYSCSQHPDSVNRESGFTERLVKIETVLKQEIKGESLQILLFQKYLAMWTKEAIQEMLQRSAEGLKSGTTHLSLSSAVRSVFQHTFNKFLANCILDINSWSNLDILHEGDSDAETDEVFVLVLSALVESGVPLKELMLHRDVYRHHDPLPLEMANSETMVFFPFYYHLSSYIDMVIDKVNAASSETRSQVDECADISKIVQEVKVMLGMFVEDSSGPSAPINESMAQATRGVIEAVQASHGLFERYLMHMLHWKFRVKDLSWGITWISNQMREMSSAASTCNRCLICLHLVTRMTVTDIIRISSWDLLSETISEEKVDPNEVSFKGPQLLGPMLRHFKSSFGENSASLKEWGHSFVVFMQSIPDIIGAGKRIDDPSLIKDLRQLAFLSVAINVNAPDAAVTSMTGQVSERENHSICDFFDLLENTADGDTCWIKDARKKLLRTLFCPRWINCVSDINFADAKFLIASIKGEIVESPLEHQMAVVHLRNLLLNDVKGSKSLLPTKCFSPSIARLVCGGLSCPGLSDYCEESEKRKRMPHYIPPWLRGESGTDTVHGTDDNISWFFQNYDNSFTNCPLADVVFDIMLGVMAGHVSSGDWPSDQILLLFETSINAERNISLKERIRNARLVFQLESSGTASFIGSHLSSLESSALLICFVCKIAQELCTASPSPALSEISAQHILCRIMTTHRWADLFFSMILRLRGEDYLASLLGEGGALSSFEWCNRWKHGISSLEENVTRDLAEARRVLQQTQDDMDLFSRHYLACPHCRGLFGVDQRNCGQFTCGRDAHGVGGGPAVGGRAVRETNGCGQTFSINQALPYARSTQHDIDRAALLELREDTEQKQRAFHEFNQSAELWRQAAQFTAPCISFCVQRENEGRMFPAANLTEHMAEEGDDSSTRLLVRVLRHLPLLEHLTYLSDMIELYVFMHKTFRHIVTKDVAMNLKISDVMSEHLLAYRFGSLGGSHLGELWGRVVEGFNAFTSANNSMVRWNCQDVIIPFCNLNDTSLISILSETEDPTEGHDYLFLVINELVLRYNNFIESVKTISNSNCPHLKVEEIHPRTLVRRSKDSIMVNGVVSHTQGMIENLIESYWNNDERSFDTEGLSKAISFDVGMIGQLQPIKSPFSFLREKFVFRESSTDAKTSCDLSDVCYRSSDGLFFARNEDLSIYEQVKEHALEKGFIQGRTAIRHTVAVTFQTFSHDEWTSLLEGIRNVLGYLEQTSFSNGEEPFGQAIAKFHGSTTILLTAGFPSMDDTQLNFLNAITNNDIMELICVCGEQLSSEAYRFVGTSSRLTEPLTTGEKDSIQEGVMSLLESKSSQQVVKELDSLCEDVLEFYCDRLIALASESSNESLSVFLQRNNCCDDATNEMLAAIPESITIRNYIDVQKVLHQTKLKVLFGIGKKKSATNDGLSVKHVDGGSISGASGGHEGTCNLGRKGRLSPLDWRWVSKLESSEDKHEKYSWKAFGNLWFEDALLKSSIDLEGRETESFSDEEVEEENLNILVCDEPENAITSASEESATPFTKELPADQEAHVTLTHASTAQDVITKKHNSEEDRKISEKGPKLIILSILVVTALASISRMFFAKNAHTEIVIDAVGGEEIGHEF